MLPWGPSMVAGLGPMPQWVIGPSYGMRVIIRYLRMVPVRGWWWLIRVGGVKRVIISSGCVEHYIESVKVYVILLG